MKKGDVRKQQILETAERLFYQNGYENTSVQMILDEMNLSKGGFYHHFESKLSLLEAICVRKAEESYENVEQVVYDMDANALTKLNALLGRSGLFDQDSMDFIALMLQVAYREGSILLRERMKQASMARALTYMQVIISQGIREKVFYTPHREEIGKMLLMLGHNLTDEIASAIASDGPAHSIIGKVVSLLETYRHSIELILNAPYGSIVLYDVYKIVDMYCKIKGLITPPEFIVED